ncbi:MAG: hypothetical protein ACOC5K_02580 [Chloroflexota bacterium]
MNSRWASLARASWLVLALGVGGVVLRTLVIFSRVRWWDWEVAGEVIGLALKDAGLVVGLFVIARVLLAMLSQMEERETAILPEAGASPEETGENEQL